MASADKDKLGADLSAYVDGELSPERAREIERLLAESQEARRTVADLRVISQGLAGLPRKRAPEDLAQTVRRSAERQVLLQEGARAGRARVLKLFARVSASAALIFACVFAGWTVLQRVHVPTPTAAERGIVVGRAPVADDEVAETVARGFVSKEAAGIEVAEADVGEAVAEAPAIAMGERLEALGYVGDALREGIHALESEALVAGEPTPPPSSVTEAVPSGLVAAVGAPVADVTPAVSVVVRPRNADEYNATLRTVALWQQAPAATAELAVTDLVAKRPGRQRGAAAFTAKARGKGTPSVITQRDFTVQVAPSEFNALLLALDQQAPGQVRAEIDFNAREIAHVQRMVTPAPATTPRGERLLAYGQPAYTEPALDLAPADTSAPDDEGAPRTDDAQAGRFAGRAGGRGRVVRGPPPPQRARAESPAESKKAAGPEAREKIDAKALRALEALGYVGTADEDQEAEQEPAAGRKEDSTELRRGRMRAPPAKADTTPERRAAPPKAADKVETVKRAPLDAETTTDGPPQPAVFLPGDRLGRATQLRERLNEAYRILLGLAFQTDLAKDRAKPSPTPVTLRVTLLPPPPPAATRPTAPPQPATPPGETP